MVAELTFVAIGIVIKLSIRKQSIIMCILKSFIFVKIYEQNIILEATAIHFMCNFVLLLFFLILQENQLKFFTGHVIICVILRLLKIE